MDIPNGITGQDYVVSFANYLLLHWGVGSSNCDNGAVLFVSVEDKQAHITTGRSLETSLPDWRRNAIISTLLNEISNGDIDHAVLNAVISMGDSIKEGADGKWWIWLIAVVLLLILACLLKLGWTRYNKAKKEKKKLVWEECQLKLELIEREVKGNTSLSISCPICLEVFHDQETRSLTCGHKYCYRCISELTKPSPTISCPICSQLTDEQEDDDVSKLETKFRLESLKQKYPTFVSNSLINSLTENPYHEKWASHHHWGRKYKNIFYHNVNEENSHDEESSEAEENKSIQNLRTRIPENEVDDSILI